MLVRRKRLGYFINIYLIHRGVTSGSTWTRSANVIVVAIVPFYCHDAIYSGNSDSGYRDS